MTDQQQLSADIKDVNTGKSSTDVPESVSRFYRFQQIFLIFFIFSLVGHFIEIIWA